MNLAIDDQRLATAGFKIEVQGATALITRNPDSPVNAGLDGVDMAMVARVHTRDGQLEFHPQKSAAQRAVLTAIGAVQ
jgi:hypothetical protein